MRHLLARQSAGDMLESNLFLTAEQVLEESVLNSLSVSNDRNGLLKAVRSAQGTKAHTTKREKIAASLQAQGRASDNAAVNKALSEQGKKAHATKRENIGASLQAEGKASDSGAVDKVVSARARSNNVQVHRDRCTAGGGPPVGPEHHLQPQLTARERREAIKSSAAAASFGLTEVEREEMQELRRVVGGQTTGQERQVTYAPRNAPVDGCSMCNMFRENPEKFSSLSLHFLRPTAAAQRDPATTRRATNFMALADLRWSLCVADRNSVLRARDILLQTSTANCE